MKKQAEKMIEAFTKASKKVTAPFRKVYEIIDSGSNCGCLLFCVIVLGFIVFKLVLGIVVDEGGDAFAQYSQTQATNSSSSISDADLESPFFDTTTDSRDNKTYKTVKIGDQVWMTENLNFKAKNSFCYDNDISKCEKYGRLYTWEAAMKACPGGWHLPNNVEWTSLWDAVGGKNVAGKKLKSKNGWERNGNGDDIFGFAIQAVGYRSDNGYFGEGEFAFFWSSIEYNSSSAYNWNIRYNDLVIRNGSSKNAGLSVRCLQDSN